MIKPLAKSVLIPLGLTTAASAADAGIHKKILGSGNATSIISNEEMNDIIKIVQALEDSNILLKGVTKLGASLLGNLLTGKGIVRVGTVNNSLNKKGKGIVRADTGNKKEWHF